MAESRNPFPRTRLSTRPMCHPILSAAIEQERPPDKAEDRGSDSSSLSLTKAGEWRPAAPLRGQNLGVQNGLMKSLKLLLGAWLLGCPSVLASDLYTEEVKPLLAEKCVSCHGPVRQEAGLRLDAAQLIREGSHAGEIVSVEDADDSELIWRVTADGGSQMPPADEGTALTAEEVKLLTRWIAQGLEAPADEVILEGPRDHWSFQPIDRPPVPLHRPESASEADSIHIHPIDAFIEAKLAEAGLRSASAADRETILRRLTFGLLGLPPTPQQRDVFLAIDSDAEERRFVEMLLADPAHAERWARHWMDVWRYSDWDGYKDQLRGSQRHIWRWRDWIVESLSADRSYAQMIREMIAGDELAPLDDDTLRATGFLARNYHKSNRNIWLDATVEHTAKAFVGLTIDCARCHDHKYDPLSQEEYYQFRAIFEPHQVRTDRVAGVLDTMQDGLPRAYDAELDAETPFLIGGNEKLPDESKEIVPDVPEVVGVPFVVEPRSVPPLAARPGLRPQRAEDDVRAARRAVEQAQTAVSKAAPEEADLAARKLAVAEAKLASLQARLAADRARHLGRTDEAKPDENAKDEDANASADAQTLAIEAAARERELAVAQAELKVVESQRAVADAKQGEEETDSDSEELEKVRKTLADAEAEQQAAVKALEQTNGDYTPVGPTYPTQSSGRRTALADWITHPDNPLTARVAVNHVWMRHFGQPLVENTFDFGLRSPRPQHAELLDWLAAELIDSGWSMKHLHRLIVSSQTYRQASQLESEADQHNGEIDPDNHLFWHFNVIRLEAEVIRDAVMAAAGDLDLRMGGPEIDYERGEEVLRRSLYFRHAYEKQMTMLTTFDAASPNECYRRSPSIIPQQALVLSNSQLSRKMASRLAASIRSELTRESSNESSASQVFARQAFLRVLGRAPDEQEQAACVEFLQSGQPEMNLVHALMNHNDFVVIR